MAIVRTGRADERLAVQIVKEAGRGEVAIVESPALANGFSLSIRIDDSHAPGAARYRWFLVAEPLGDEAAPSHVQRPKSGSAVTSRR